MTPAEAAERRRTAAVAHEWYERCSAQYRYGQVRPYPPDLYAEGAANKRIDCSSSFILINKKAGNPDPNGTAYDGSGWTGSLINRGVRVREIMPGDAIFYGDAVGRTGHVTTADEDPRFCISFGSTPISRRPVGYRPIIQVRRYPVGIPEPEPEWYVEELPAKAGGIGPEVLGPWDSQADRDVLRARLAERGQRVAAMNAPDDRFYIYRYAPGTHGRKLRRGPWTDEADAKNGLARIRKATGRRMRLYLGRVNSYYPA